MSLEQSNVRYLILGEDANLSTADKPENLNVGEIGIFDPYGNRKTVSGTSQGDPFTLYLNRGGSEPLVNVPTVYPGKDTVTARSALYSAAQEQVSYIGYNPSNSAGSIDAISDNHYIVDLHIQEYLVSSSDGRWQEHGDYYSSPSADQREVALGLAANLSLSLNHKHSTEEFMRFGAINEATATNSNDFDNDSTIRKGSEFIGFPGGFTGAPVYGGGTLAVGDFVRIAPSAGTATDNADHVYEVVAIDDTANEVKLDRPVRQPSATITGNNGNGIEVIPSGSIGTNWGVKLEGLPTKFDRLTMPYHKVRFETTLNGDFGTTDYSDAQGAREGQGTFEQMAELEQFLQGNFGEVYRTPVQSIYDKWEDVTQGETFNQHDLTIKKLNDPSISARTVSPWMLKIAAPSSNPGYFDDSTTDSITQVINVALTGSTGGPLTTS